MEINGKGAVVTGAGSGIGAGIAQALAAAGADVIIADVELAKAEEVAGRVTDAGGKAFAFHCDVRDYAAIEALADFAWDKLGHVEILCNNAGVTVQGPGIGATQEDLRWTFDVNVYGVWNGMRVFAPRFVEAGKPAWIVNTGSHHSIGAPTKNIALYVGSKHAVLGLSDAFRSELAGKVGFSVLCPGIIATEMWDAERNRPPEYGAAHPSNPEQGKLVHEIGFPARAVGDLVVNGIKAEDFWIWTHPQDIALIEKRYREGVDAIKRQWPDGPTPLHKQTPSHV